MGVRVEVKQGRRWWYVQVDFGDGTQPVAKGPMAEEDARAMAAELEKQAAQGEGVTLRDKSVEEEAADRRMGMAVIFGTLVVTLLSIAGTCLVFFTQ